MGGSYAATGMPQQIGSVSYNANNQLTQWGDYSLYYDQNGNMTSDGVNSYSWNALNQLASMNFYGQDQGERVRTGPPFCWFRSRSKPAAMLRFRNTQL